MTFLEDLPSYDILDEQRKERPEDYCTNPGTGYHEPAGPQGLTAICFSQQRAPESCGVKSQATAQASDHLAPERKGNLRSKAKTG